MSKLLESLNTSATTVNGAATNYSSLSKCLDFFYLVGASRNKDITPTFIAALAENRELALRILLWSRDIRKGAGERSTFRKLYQYLGLNNNSTTREYASITYKIPELGRWDDLLFCGDRYKLLIKNIIKDALLYDHEYLCAKWMPRKGPWARELREHMHLTPKEYRKLLVTFSNTVEQKMCANKWTEINYEHVPSIASAKYQNSFKRHDPKGYEEYKNKLSQHTAKINAGAIYPHDIIKSLYNGDSLVSEIQWKSLPNYLENNTNRILPVVDVSGSMGDMEYNGTLPIHIAVALGLYISERNEGIYKDEFITFSEVPKLIKLQGNLRERIEQLINSEWGLNTDFISIFSLILNKAKEYNLSNEDLPETILVLSDMEFDEAADGMLPYDLIKQYYNESGYDVPNLVFWNLCARQGNVPVTINDQGVALVSGFSPVILKSVLSDRLNPTHVMLDIVMEPRYKLAD